MFLIIVGFSCSFSILWLTRHVLLIYKDSFNSVQIFKKSYQNFPFESEDSEKSLAWGYALLNLQWISDEIAYCKSKIIF